MKGSAVKTFDDWCKHIFDRACSQPAWYRTEEGDWEPAKAQSADYLANAFEGAKGVFEPYSDNQLKQGLNYLVDNGCSGYMYSLIDKEVPWPARKRGIQSIYGLFEQCFASRCSPRLSSIDEPGRNLLNGICYMWWDVFPYHGHPTQVEWKDTDEQILAVMEKALGIAHDACRESVLHGLGHWHVSYPKRVESAIDSFLFENPGLRPELNQYALSARAGKVN